MENLAREIVDAAAVAIALHQAEFFGANPATLHIGPVLAEAAEWTNEARVAVVAALRVVARELYKRPGCVNEGDLVDALADEVHEASS